MSEAINVLGGSDGSSKYKCPVCPFVGKQPVQFANHVNNHTTAHDVKCRFCSFSSTTYWIQKHEELHSSLSEDAQRSVESRSPQEEATASGALNSQRRVYECSECPFACETLHEYNSHEKVHVEHRNARCGFCSYAPTGVHWHKIHESLHFPSKRSAATKRKKSPINVNRYKCRHLDCPFTCGKFQHFIIHQKSHKGSGSAKGWLSCDSDTTDHLPKDNLQLHVIPAVGTQIPMRKLDFQITELVPAATTSTFQCESCPSVFTREAKLHAHMKLHGNMGNFKCDSSDLATNRLGWLLTHKVVHQLEEPQTFSSSAASTVSFPVPSPSHTEASTSDSLDGDGPTPMETSPSSADSASSPSPAAEAASLTDVTTFVETGTRSSRQESDLVNHCLKRKVRIENITNLNREIALKGMLKLTYGAKKGKSSLILATMLGLGYDLFLPEAGESATACGIRIQDIIAHSASFGQIQLTFCLGAFPELEMEFGDHITFYRRFTRTSDEDNLIIVTSSNENCEEIKLFGARAVQLFLRRMCITPRIFRLMLLDRENVEHLMNNMDLWFLYFEEAVTHNLSHDAKVEEWKQQLDFAKFSENQRVERVKYLREEARFGFTDEKKQLLDEAEQDLKYFVGARMGFEKNVRESILEKRPAVAKACLESMCIVFNKFLDKLGLKGDILVSSERKILACCVCWSGYLDEEAPNTLEAIQNQWRAMSVGKKEAAVMGLYLALWEISVQIQLFAADAYSCSEGEFNVPQKALPVILEVMKKKTAEGKQCIISLPQGFP